MSFARNSRRERARGVSTVLALAMFAAIVPSSHAQSQPAATYQISVDVDLVVLPVTVRDRQGRNVSDLRESDFKVYEDRVLQSIRLFQHEDIPVVAGLLVDHSGSMRPKIAEVIAGARAFVRSSNPQDRMFVVNFNESVSLGLPHAIEFTADPNQLERAIWRDPAVGETALYDAIVKSACEIADRRLGQEGTRCHQRRRRQCQLPQLGTGARDGRAFQRHHLHRRPLCARRSRRESEGAQTPGAGDWW